MTSFWWKTLEEHSFTENKLNTDILGENTEKGNDVPLGFWHLLPYSRKPGFCQEEQNQVRKGKAKGKGNYLFYRWKQTIIKLETRFRRRFISPVLEQKISSFSPHWNSYWSSLTKESRHSMKNTQKPPIIWFTTTTPTCLIKTIPYELYPTNKLQMMQLLQKGKGNDNVSKHWMMTIYDLRPIRCKERAEIERIASVEESFGVQPPNLFHKKTRKVTRRTCCACRAPNDREGEKKSRD